MKLTSLVIVSVLLLFTGTGCLKDKGFDDNKYGLNHPEDSPVGVGFAQALNKINVTSINNEDTAQTMLVALTNLLSDEPADQDIHVTIEQDPTVVTAYNTADDNNDGVFDNVPLAAMPASAYTIKSLSVVIPKGQRTVFLSLTIPKAKSTLDLTKTYGFGFRIASVQEQGITISSNLRRTLVGVAIKNKYDGVYSMKGYSLRAGDPAKTGNFTGEEMTLVTAGADIVDFADLQVWADHTGVGIGEPKLDINPATNKVTITSSGGATNAPGYDSRYDPATKTFYISFTWGGGPLSRLATDTLTYLRPR
jgi:hypothetical protein